MLAKLERIRIETRVPPFWGPLVAISLALLFSAATAIDVRVAALWGAVWMFCVVIWAFGLFTDVYDRAMPWVGLAASMMVLADAFALRGRAYSFGNPNIAASLLLLTVPWMKRPLSFVGIAALIATYSRGAWLAMVAALAILMWRPTKLWHWLATGVGLLIIAGILIALRPQTAINRLVTWREAVQLFAQRPLTGWGPNSYMRLAEAWPGKEHPDSAILWLAAEQGVMALLAWGWLVVSVGRAIAGPPGTPARLALFALALHNVIDATLYFPIVAIFAAANLAALARHYEDFSTQENLGCNSMWELGTGRTAITGHAEGKLDG